IRSAPMALPQEVAYLCFRTSEILALADLGHDRADRTRAGMAGTEDAVLRRRQRHDHQVVLIGALRILALAVEHADDAQGGHLHPHGFPDRFGRAEQRLGDGATENDNLPGAVALLARKAAPARNWPFARLEEICVGAEQHGRPVEIADDYLRGAAH